MLRQSLKWALVAILVAQAWAVPIFITPDGSTSSGSDVLPLGPGDLAFGDSTLQQITDSSVFSTGILGSNLTGPLTLVASGAGNLILLQASASLVRHA